MNSDGEQTALEQLDRLREEYDGLIGRVLQEETNQAHHATVARLAEICDDTARLHEDIATDRRAAADRWRHRT